MKDSQRVVVVDGLPETEEVLKAVLEPRGVAVSRCRSNRLADVQRNESPPWLLVVHDSSDAASAISATAAAAASSWESVPRVVIGRAEIAETPSPEPAGRLSHPFQYRELIQAVEQLLSEPRSTPRRAA